jgi:hypothetical protein
MRSVDCHWPSQKETAVKIAIAKDRDRVGKGTTPPWQRSNGMQDSYRTMSEEVKFGRSWAAP